MWRLHFVGSRPNSTFVRSIRCDSYTVRGGAHQGDAIFDGTQHGHPGVDIAHRLEAVRGPASTSIPELAICRMVAGSSRSKQMAILQWRALPTWPVLANIVASWLTAGR